MSALRKFSLRVICSQSNVHLGPQTWLVICAAAGALAGFTFVGRRVAPAVDVLGVRLIGYSSVRWGLGPAGVFPVIETGRF